MKAIVMAALVVVLGGVARADTVDDLVSKLGTSADDKERLSAVASLAKDGDRRAIDAFIEALVGDEAKSVRAVAAVGLGRVVTQETTLDDRNRAMAALERAGKDKDPFVKKMAKKALAKLKKLDDAAGSVSPGNFKINHVSASSAMVTGPETGSSLAAPAADTSGWSAEGWTLLGEDDVDLIEDEVEVDRRKSTWSEVAIVVTGDAVQLDAVELALGGKGRKRLRTDIAQIFRADSRPRIIALTGKRRTIDKVRLTYTKHTLDGQTRVQVWAR